MLIFSLLKIKQTICTNRSYMYMQYVVKAANANYTVSVLVFHITYNKKIIWFNRYVLYKNVNSENQ